jgi:ABC-2 type transport system permease protein
MNDPTPPAKRYSALWELMLARLREFLREPEALFWVYGFPILMVVSLGIAFRNKPAEQIPVDIQMTADSKSVAKIKDQLTDDGGYVVKVNDEEECHKRLRTGKTTIVVIPGGDGKGYQYYFDPTRPEGRAARIKVNDTLQRAEKRQEKVEVATDKELNEPGGAYIDFLIPGLLGMSLMGGGLWGVGFATVDLRIRKILKRFLATPMRKSDFLAAIVISRLIFLVPEVFVLLLFARLAFGVVITGSLLSLGVVILLGALTFAGIGLLVACRAKTLEAVSGLMNLVMLPMWMLSGIFFSSDHFPAAAQPFIQALPLTPLINALRTISQEEGANLITVWPQVLILIAWASGSFLLALRWFRWN